MHSEQAAPSPYESTKPTVRIRSRRSEPVSWLATLARIHLLPATSSGARKDPNRPATRPCRWVAAASALVAITFAGCGSSSHPATTSSGPAHTTSTTASARPRPARLVYRPLFSLAAPLRDPASATLPDGHLVLIGGLDEADSSTAGIELASLHRTLHTFTLPLAQHDAQGAALGDRVYVFGGGSFSELDHILSFDPATGTVTEVGHLPHAQSDVGVAELGGTAYIVGGYDGVNWFNTILAWRPGSPVKVAGHLPVGLRYSAVTPVDGRLLVIGGSTPSAASDAIYSFDPATGAVTRIGRLRHPITHGSAATLGSTAYLIGGRGELDNEQTAAIWAIDPHTGAVTAAGRLPRALSDTGTVAVGGAIVVAGGLEPSGQTSSEVGELVPAQAG